MPYLTRFRQKTSSAIIQRLSILRERISALCESVAKGTNYACNSPFATRKEPILSVRIYSPGTPSFTTIRCGASVACCSGV